MGILEVFRVAVGLLNPVQPATIISTMDPWTLACAVGADNGTIGTTIGFDMWLRLSRKNWMPQVQQKTRASEAEIEFALRHFVRANAAKNYRVVLREEESRRGQAPTPVLGPGESMTITVPLEVK